MFQSQWKSFTFWISAILVMILATIFYQPAAARTGSLLVWTRNFVYVMDIDTLTLERVAPAAADQTVAASPGCAGLADAPCWVLVDDRLYRVELSAGGSTVSERRLPLDQDHVWRGGAANWSPDGRHLAYATFDRQTAQTVLHVYDTAADAVKITAAGVDAEIAVAWSAACIEGLAAPDCKIGYKKMAAQAENEELPVLVGFTPATEAVERWTISPEDIFELRWSPDSTLLYSRPKRHFLNPEDHSPAFDIPAGAKLANLSPDARHTVYYQPFRLTDCDGTRDECLLLGVWLRSADQEEPALIYNVDLPANSGGLNFIPVWSPSGEAFVFFQEGRLVHYDVAAGEATIWHKSLNGKLRSVPVFSPNEAAVAFVDNQGQGFSDYRLVVINPRLQPVEHIIETETGFKVLAWLPE